MQQVISGLPTFDDDHVQNMANQARYAQDDKLYVRFKMMPVLNAFKSQEAGRAIYDEKEYIVVVIPGDSKTTGEFPVDDIFRRRFPKQYAAFKEGRELAASGTPLEMWPQMTVGMVAELKAMNIRTVEELAALDDGRAQKIMGSHDLRRRAQVFIEAAKGEATNNKIVVELEKRDEEIAELKRQMAELLKAQVKTQPKAA